MGKIIFATAVITLFCSLTATAQNVGINTPAPNAALDINGDIAIRSQVLTVADGVTYALDVNTAKYSNYRLTGPTGNFVIAGITAGANGRLITLYNLTGQSVELYNEDAATVAANRIKTGTGATVAIYNNGTAVLQYDITANRWQLQSTHNSSLNYFGSGSGSWNLVGNDIINTNTGAVGIGVSVPDASSVLDVNSQAKGMLMPRLTTSQKNAISNPATGLLVYDLDKAAIYLFDGYAWRRLSVTSPMQSPIQSVGINGLPEEASFGNALDVEGNFAVIGCQKENTNGVFEQGSAYVYQKINGVWMMVQKLSDTGLPISSLFGQSVGISGDFIIVAAPLALNGAIRTGAVYVYKKNGTSWDFFVKLLPPDGGDGDFFGRSVAISNNNIVVGAPWHDRGIANTGAAYTYKYNGTTWNYLTKLADLSNTADEQFGASVDISLNKIVIGAPYADRNPYTDCGAVFPFVLNASNTNWIDQPAVNYAGNDTHFGYKVSLDSNRFAAIYNQGDISEPGIRYYQYTAGAWAFAGSQSGLIYTNYKATDFCIKGTQLYYGTQVYPPQGIVFYKDISTPTSSLRGFTSGDNIYSGSYHFGARVATDGKTILVTEMSKVGGLSSRVFFKDIE
jgi:hypothetical protein